MFNFFWATSASLSDPYREWVVILCHQIYSILLSNIWSGVWSLQAVSVGLVLPNWSYFSEQYLLWCLISIGSEYWFCATKYIQFFWTTSALVSDLYRRWVLVLCYQICFICWPISALVSGLYREWVLILCQQIYSILLSNICFGVWSLQAVSVHFVPPNLFDFAESHLILVSNLYSLWVLIFATKSFDFSESHLLLCPISIGSECWFYATKYVWFFWATSALLSISTASECWFYATNSVWFCWATSGSVSDLYSEWVLIFVPPNLFDFSDEWYLLWCPISTGSECWFWESIWFCWAMSILVSNLYRQWVWIVLVVFSTTFLVSYHICRWYVACIVVIHCLAHHYECFSLIFLILLVCSLWVCNWSNP